MKRQAMIAALVLASLSAGAYGASSVWVNGYHRSDGTYVQGHYRSAPNATKADNFGPSQSDAERYTPDSRDWDDDGISNSYDYDDDNDGMMDDYDDSQYENPYGPN